MANGGAFGGKLNSVVAHAARTLAAENGMPVRVLLSREDVVRLGPKRPPIAAGLRLDGSGVVRVGRTPGSESLSEWVGEFLACMPSCSVEVVDIPGPPVSARIRGGGWAEGAVLKEALRSLAVRGVGEPMWTDFAGPCSLPWTAEVATKEGGRASATVSEGVVQVTVQAGTVLDAVVLRSYCVGAVHQALGWVKREAVAVDAAGNVLDLTIRSFGILPARDMPRVEVQVIDSSAPAVNVSEAVFAAAAASAWIGAGLPPRWPMNSEGGCEMSAPVGPYTPITRAGPFVVCSGQVGIAASESGPSLVDGGLEPETRQAMANVASLLGELELGWPDVFKTTVYLTDISQYSAFNAVYVEELGSHRPASTLVAVAALPIGAVVEIEAWASARS